MKISTRYVTHPTTTRLSWHTFAWQALSQNPKGNHQALIYKYKALKAVNVLTQCTVVGDMWSNADITCKAVNMLTHEAKEIRTCKAGYTLIIMQSSECTNIRGSLRMSPACCDNYVCDFGCSFKMPKSHRPYGFCHCVFITSFLIDLLSANVIGDGEVA